MATTVSLDHLRSIGACEPALEWFCGTFGDGDVEVPLATVLRAVAEHPEGTAWVDWYAGNGHLPVPAWAAYCDAIASARVARRAAVASALAAYRAAADPASGPYYADLDSAEYTYRAAARNAILAAADALDDGRPRHRGEGGWATIAVRIAAEADGRLVFRAGRTNECVLTLPDGSQRRGWVSGAEVHDGPGTASETLTFPYRPTREGDGTQ